MIVDAHQHFWKLSQPAPFDYGWLNIPTHAPIRRDYLPADLKPHLDAVGVTHSVFVQAQHHLEETRWALRLADENPWLVGVVGWVDLASPDVERQLLEFKRHKRFVGVRHITHDEADDDFIVRPDVIRGLKVLEKHRVPFDLLFFVKHLKHAATLARALPDLPMVIDHLAKPRIKDHAVDDWLPHFTAAAKFPNVFCKLSGMVTEADWKAWTVDDLKPYVSRAVDLFGPERCMYGSDWPVCELAAPYEKVHHALAEALGPLGTSEHAAIFGGTAQKFYNLR